MTGKGSLKAALRRAASRTLREIVSLFVRSLPIRARTRLFRELLLADTQIGSPEAALSRQFSLIDDLYRIIDRTAIAREGSLHPKHRLTNYHEFFINRIPANSRVLDVGCGIGAVAHSIAKSVDRVEVTGIDQNVSSIAIAKNQGLLPNMTFIVGDAACDLPAEHWDVIVLSNILEHVDDRIDLLRDLVRRNTPSRLLIRIPLFERHWHLALRRELGIDYFSDPTHRIEHTLVEFETEMAAARLRIVERQTLWGEIWAHCEPGQTKA